MDMMDDATTYEATPAAATPPAEQPAEQPPKRKRGRPRIHPVKRKLTPEELSKVRSEAGRKGGLVRHAQKVETMPIRIRMPDLDVVRRVMAARELSMPLALHLIIEFFRKRVEF